MEDQMAFVPPPARFSSVDHLPLQLKPTLALEPTTPKTRPTVPSPKHPLPFLPPPAPYPVGRRSLPSPCDKLARSRQPRIGPVPCFLCAACGRARLTDRPTDRPTWKRAFRFHSGVGKLSRSPVPPKSSDTRFQSVSRNHQLLLLVEFS